MCHVIPRLMNEPICWHRNQNFTNSLKVKLKISTLAVFDPKNSQNVRLTKGIFDFISVTYNLFWKINVNILLRIQCISVSNPETKYMFKGTIDLVQLRNIHVFSLNIRKQLVSNIYKHTKCILYQRRQIISVCDKDARNIYFIIP